MASATAWEQYLSEANFLTSSLPLFSKGLGVLRDFQNENYGREIHLRCPGLPQQCSPPIVGYRESVQYCNNHLSSVHVKVLQPWSNFSLWKAFSWCYLMRNSRAYLTITAPLNLRMSGFCSVRMLSLSTDYSKVNKYLLENHFFVKDNDNFKILKGCHIRENVHLWHLRKEAQKKRAAQ